MRYGQVCALTITRERGSVCVCVCMCVCVCVCDTVLCTFTNGAISSEAFRTDTSEAVK